MPTDLLPLAAPLPLLLAAAFGALRRGSRPRFVPQVAEAAALVAIVMAVGTLARLIVAGPST
ncbi:hypothetical protein ABTK52_18490, partial [Acinetobacter baumannii]